MNEQTNKIDDKFIDYNNELKALKFAFKKLITEISRELLRATRNFNSDGVKSLLLGRRHLELILMSMEKGFADIVDVTDSGLLLWGLTVYISIEDPYRIEIIISSKVNVQELIDDLPDTMKFKRTN